MLASEPDHPILPAGFAVDIDHVDGEQALILVSGEMDLYAAPFVEERVAEARAAGARQVMLDLSAVTFMDSSGLGVLVNQLKEFRALGGDLTLRAPSPQTRKVLEITGLDRTIPIVP